MTTINQNFDAIVVGSGPGGATVAKELSTRGKKVLILEWGSNSKIRASKIQMFNMAGRPGKGMLMTSGIPVVRGITTGGTSIFYYASAFDPPYEMLRKHGVEIEKEIEEVKSEVPYAPLSDDLMGPMAKRIMESARDLGYDWQKMPKLIYQDKCKANCWKCVYGCPYGAKWTARDYIEEAIRNGARLINKARVEKVIIENNKAVGVAYIVKGKTQKAYADKIILGAGGIGSPVILRASGIKDAGYDFFMDPLITVMGPVEDLKGGKEICMAGGVHMDDEGYLMSDMTVAKGFFMGFNAVVFNFNKIFAHKRTLVIMVKIRDRLGGMLNDDGGVRKVIAKSDWDVLNRGADRAKKILRNAGAKQAYSAMIMAAHPGGTIKIDDLVDSNLKTEYDNLYVCDCSVIPEAWGLPPTLTLLGLGKRLAKHLAE